jgi:hypothetical protein
MDGVASLRGGPAFVDAHDQGLAAHLGIHQALGAQQLDGVHLCLPAGVAQANVQVLGADAQDAALLATGGVLQQVHGR